MITARDTTRMTAPLAPMLARQTWAELLALLRTPGFSLFSVLLPTLLFGLFGVTEGKGPQLNFLLAAFATYGVVSVMLYSFGTQVALERGQRMNILMRFAPLPAAVYIAAKVITALIFTFVTLLVLALFAAFVGGVDLSLTMWASFIGRLVLGVLPFSALGFTIGYRASPTAAPTVANLVNLLMSFASGIFVNFNQLPHVVQQIAPYLPLFHLARLGWDAVGIPSASLSDDIRWLGIYTALFLWTAVSAYRRDTQRTFG